MAWSRGPASAAVDPTIRMAGRGRVVRAARFTLNPARLHSTSRMESNGEALLPTCGVPAAPDDTPIRPFDAAPTRGGDTSTLQSQATPAISVSTPSSRSTFTAERPRAAMVHNWASAVDLAEAVTPRRTMAEGMPCE